MQKLCVFITDTSLLIDVKPTGIQILIFRFQVCHSLVVLAPQSPPVQFRPQVICVEYLCFLLQYLLKILPLSCMNGERASPQGVFLFLG